MVKFSDRRFIFILMTMFLNFLGFSIIIPILPFLVGKYMPGDIALHVGLLLSSYALCQFLASPGLGALSDRYGRRPVLLISLFGSVVGYIILGVGGALWVLFLGRIIDGLTGGNISTVFAYVADITAPQERGKYYGLLGAAGGFGFMIGPALGGLLANISLATPLFVAAAVTFANMLWGYFVLPESLAHEHRSEKVNLAHLNPFLQFNHIFSIEILRRLFMSSFLFFFAFNAMYGNNSVFLKEVFLYNATQIGLLLFMVGAIDIVTQGFLVRKLLPSFGETKLAIIGYSLSVIGFALGALSAVFVSPALLYAGVVILNIGDGLAEPSLNGLISNAVGPKMQGRVQGAYQGMQSIARVLAPLFAAGVYLIWKGMPYASEALIVLVALFVLVAAIPAIKGHKVSTG
jgi:MFS transporter, DHA1 family, tetracycline resistance protein